MEVFGAEVFLRYSRFFIKRDFVIDRVECPLQSNFILLSRIPHHILLPNYKYTSHITFPIGINILHCVHYVPYHNPIHLLQIIAISMPGTSMPTKVSNMQYI